MRTLIYNHFVYLFPPVTKDPPPRRGALGRVLLQVRGDLRGARAVVQGVLPAAPAHQVGRESTHIGADRAVVSFSGEFP